MIGLIIERLEMEDLISHLRNNVYKNKQHQTSFEAYTEETAYDIYVDLQKDNSKRNIKKICSKHLFFYNNDIGTFLSELDISQHHLKPKYKITKKETKKIRSPETGRMITFESVKFWDLYERGLVDRHGNALETKEVVRIRNPRTNKLVTVGSDVFLKLVNGGWVNERGDILKVKHPSTREPLSVNDPEFEEFVKNGVFNEDGTLCKKK